MAQNSGLSSSYAWRKYKVKNIIQNTEYIASSSHQELNPGSRLELSAVGGTAFHTTYATLTCIEDCRSWQLPSGYDSVVKGLAAQARKP